MFTPAFPLQVPAGPVTAYFLSGQWFPKDCRPTPPPSDEPRFRDAPILRTVAVPPSQAADCREIIADVESYGGDPARCFTPRHGLSFAADDGPPTDVLICFECHSLYFFQGEGRELFALTERTMQRLGVFFSLFGPIITPHHFR